MHWHHTGALRQACTCKAVTMHVERKGWHRVKSLSHTRYQNDHG